MSGTYYDGTSAYKIEQYNAYTSSSEQRQMEHRQKQIKQKLITRKRLITLASVVVVIASVFLYLNVLLLQSSAAYTTATKELEDVKMRNAQLSFDISSGLDLAMIETKAKSEFGMQRPETHQSVYVNVVQNDYVETFTAQKSDKGFVENMVTGLKSFLAYIG